jgi:hypothetical protein
MPTSAPVVSHEVASESHVEDNTSANPGNIPGMICVKDHPNYITFFKLLKVGVPAQVVKAKLFGAGQIAAYYTFLEFESSSVHHPPSVLQIHLLFIMY